MEVFELILMLLLAVLLSSILDQVVPRISSPLIQIALGIGIAMLAISPIEVNIDPELFLVLFIAPLLFSDALEADKRNLWENKTTIVSFAIGLVIVITLCVGFVLHWLVPSIPLAAAFALGAALGPTDAVAVQALKKEAKLGKREGAILQGEALINDASGVVSFQFAVAAAVTGAFSLANAATSFAIGFIGGIALGILLAVAFLYINKRIREMGLDNVTFHVLFEVSMPLVVFLFSELVGVSGILAVVACGIMWSMYRDRKISPYQSRLNIALTSVWKVIGFVLNGVVFVLLGIQLPNAMQSTWDNLYIDNFVLIGYVLLLTVLIVVLRFVWALIMTRLIKNPDTGKRDRFSLSMIKDSLVTTVGGPKGAITLSIAFTIPFLLADGSTFPQRSLIIFLASGVIVCTLLLANFLLPVLAPKEEAEDDDMDWDEEILGEMEGGYDNRRFSSYWNSDNNMTYPLILAKIPVKNPWEIFAYLPFGGWNECPNTPKLMAVAKYWFEQHGAVPAAMSHDELEFLLPAPVSEEKAMDAAVELYGFCPDVIDQGPEDATVGALADVLRQSTVWYFWWD